MSALEDAKRALEDAIGAVRARGVEFRPNLLIGRTADGAPACCLLGAVLIHRRVLDANATSVLFDERALMARAAELLGVTQYQAASIAHGFDLPNDGGRPAANPWARLGAELRLRLPPLPYEYRAPR